MINLFYLFAGIYFGIILIKSEVVSWFRIQEMFLFDSFHMYGIIGTAIVVGVLSVQVIKRSNFKSLRNEVINLDEKELTKGTLVGGIIFGLGWSLVGACPGPLYALIGAGNLIIVVPLLSALLGAFIYGLLADKLPR